MMASGRLWQMARWRGASPGILLQMMLAPSATTEDRALRERIKTYSVTYHHAHKHTHTRTHTDAGRHVVCERVCRTSLNDALMSREMDVHPLGLHVGFTVHGTHVF